ncbi:MAG: D-alanyl-D-alanine carboxypeptidase [Gammaproteobacteria bacterium]|nr:D-alanyl-D-alanine carboxypeptidase [Gammaproteobacteria bacterium]
MSKSFAVLLCGALFALDVAAAAPGVPGPPQIPGTAHVLLDFASGDVLAEANADQGVEPASLTKIMTVYVIATELAKGGVKLDDLVTISEKAWRTGGSKMFVEVGKKVTVTDLLHGIIIQSGNDASVALAEHVSGDETVFAELMNQHAARLGLSNTHFANATGLPDPTMRTTARDVAKLGAALIRDFPEIYGWFSAREFVFNGIRQENRNMLLDIDPSVDGIKTGHTEAAGYCLAASARRDDMRLLAVVMGTDSTRTRASATQALLNYGFRFYESHQVYDAGAVIETARVWQGSTETVPLGLGEPLHLVVPRGRYQDLQAKVEVRNPLLAPIAAGSEQGMLRISLDGKELKAVPLRAQTAVPEAGLFGRLYDRFLLLFE